MADILFEKDLPSGKTIYVLPLTFGRARIAIGPTGNFWFDDGW
jgi:hypothetical protein